MSIVLRVAEIGVLPWQVEAVALSAIAAGEGRR
jgi:hypothetical protein